MTKRRISFDLWLPSLPRNWRAWLPSRGSVVFTLLVLAVVLVWSGSVGAFPFRAPAAPTASTSTIPYQGRLANASGQPLTGQYGMIFRLYNAATGGVALWEEQWTGSNSVRVSDGLFNVMLGSLTPIALDKITGNSTLWLGITVGADSEMAPRVQLGSVPYAMQALTVPDGSIGTAKIADGAVTQAKLASGAGMAYSSLYRQALVNGNFDVWQRGTSSACSGQTYTADRWFGFRQGGVAGMTVSRQDGTGVAGSRYGARVQRDSGNSASNSLEFWYNTIETNESVKFVGQKVTISFWARKGADYSVPSSALQFLLMTGTGTDEGMFSVFTGQELAINQTIYLTSNWMKHTFTTNSVIAPQVKEMGLTFTFRPTGTAGAADYFEIAQVQLSAGAVAPPFEPKSYEEELRACQRYYEKSYDYAVAPGTSTASGSVSLLDSDNQDPKYIATTVFFKVPKRTQGSRITLYDSVGNSGKISEGTVDGMGRNNVTPPYPHGVQSTGENAFSLVHYGAATGVSFHWTADAEL